MKNVEYIYRNFLKNIKSIDLFFEQFSIIAKEKDETIEDSFKDEVASYFDDFKDLLDEIAREQKEKSTEEPVEECEPCKEEAEKAKKLLNEKFIDYAQQRFKKKHVTKIVQPRNFDIMSRSVFLMLNNYLEYLFADLITYHHTKYPGTLSSKEFSLSLEQINEYESISDLTDYLVQQNIEQMLIEKTFPELLDYFNKDLEISTEEKKINWDLITECRERRHLIVHNSSKVNKKYLTRINYSNDYTIGDEVEISENYFSKALDEITVAGILILFNCWGKWDKDNITNAFDEMLELSFNLLHQERTWVSEKISKYALDNMQARNEDQHDYLLRIRFNYCIALKRRGDEKSIKSALKDVHIASMSPLFKLAYKILMDEYEDLEVVFKQAKALEELSLESYMSWPLFEFIRGNEELHSKIITIYNPETLTSDRS